jgi:hypothetical protein
LEDPSAAGHSELSSAQTYQPLLSRQVPQRYFCAGAHQLTSIVSNSSGGLPTNAERRKANLEVDLDKIELGNFFPELSFVTKAINLDAAEEVYIKTLKTRPQLYSDIPDVFISHLPPTLWILCFY